MSYSDAAKQIIEDRYQSLSEWDFLTFVRGLHIPSSKGDLLFAEVMASFQVECLEALAPNLEALREGQMPDCRRFWIERTKKASKDGDLGCSLLWLLAFPHKPLLIQIGAADKDQAAIVRRRMVDTVHWNPWLNDHLSIGKYNAESTNGLARLEIVAADIAGSHGETPDLLLINELSHVTKWEFVENLLDNADGVPQGIVIIATNAGFRGTKAEIMMKNAKTSPNWFFHSLKEPAPWMNPDDLVEARRRNTRTRFRRLWYGEWASGKGDALEEEDIDRCVESLPGPITKPKTGYTYLGGLDLGVSHDHCGLVVVGVSPALQKIELAHMEAHKPSEETGEVDLMLVEKRAQALSKLFRVTWFGYDPSQAKLMAQRLSKKGCPMQEVTFTPSNLSQMAESFLQCVKNRLLHCFDLDGILRRDFGKFDIVEKTYGYRLEATSDEYGHADVGTALVITLPRAMSMLRGTWDLQPDENLAYDLEDFKELTPEEMKDVPPGLRSILDVYDEFAKEGHARRGHRG